jgi:hypothetical protein
VCLAGDFHQLRRDAQLCAGSPHTSLQAVLHAKFFADLTDGLQRVLVAHRRSPRNHTHALRVDTPQTHNHFLGQPVGEVFLLGTAADIAKRQHGDHLLSGSRSFGDECFNWGNEAVAASRQGFDEARILASVSEGLP